MERYEQIYSHNIVAEIKDGNIVYALDKEMAEVLTLNFLSIEKVLKIINDGDELRSISDSRYYFYKLNDTINNTKED